MSKEKSIEDLRKEYETLVFSVGYHFLKKKESELNIEDLIPKIREAKSAYEAASLAKNASNTQN